MERRRPFGVLLRAHREAAGLTQQRLASRAGVSVGAVRDIEQGRTTVSRPDTLARLAAVLELNGREQASLAGAHGAGGRAVPGHRHAQDGARKGVWLVLLGPLMAWRDGVPVALGSARQQAVLGLLALHGAGVSRNAIMDVLWGSEPPSTALGMVHGYISRIRRLLGPDGDGNGRRQPSRGELSWDGTAYRLTPGTVRSDVEEFGALVERARQAGATGEPTAACRLYEQALQLWRGAPLAESELLQDHPAVVGLSGRRASVVIEYSDAAAAVGEHERVVGYLRALAQHEPLNERVHARLMIALSALGQQAAGLRLFEDLRRRLDEELGVRPGPELTDAHLRVLRQDFTPPGEAAIVPSGTAPVTGGRNGRAKGPGTADPAVPHQLPPAAPHFAGRAAELSALDEMLGQADQAAGTVLITTVGGTAGVGKTALAVHWARQVADRFPDGQLYVNLRGYGPSRRPLAPAGAISAFLEALQVPPERIPTGLDARAGLYRSLLAGKRMLIVLDNARSADQVRPLLPGSPACLVVVTSRSHLSGLAVEGARPLVLDILTHADARKLLAIRLDAERLAAEPQATDGLIGFCARLPLALSVAAARAARHPGFPLAAIAADLRDERHRLDALDTGDGATAVRAVFSWSYRLLSEPAARLFRLLGAYPGPDITGPAAASLAGMPRAQAVRTLGELARSCLLTEHVAGRFACHDLLRAYAAELARPRRREPGQRAALHRVLDHYLHTCYAANRLMDTSRDPITLAPPQPGVIPESFTSLGAAQAWCLDEYPALAAAITQAARGGFSSHAWQISWAAETFIHRRAGWQDFAPVQEVALVAVQHQRDRAGEAHMRSALGRSRAILGSLDEAHRHLSLAVDLFQQLADRGGEAAARIRIGLVSARQGLHAEARAHAQQAFELYRSTGNRTGQAGALNNLGWYAIRLGQHEEALRCCQEALGIFRELGDVYGEGIAQGSIGSAYLHLGRHAQCLTHCQASYDLLNAVGESYQQGHTLDILGDAHYATRNRQAAQQAWQQALDILAPVGEPAANQIREKLRRIR